MGGRSGFGKLGCRSRSVRGGLAHLLVASYDKPAVKLFRNHVEGQQLVFPGIPILDFHC